MGHLPVRRGGRLYGQRARDPYRLSTRTVATRHIPNANIGQASSMYTTPKTRGNCARAHKYALSRHATTKNEASGARPNDTHPGIDPADLRKANNLRAQMEYDIQKQYKAKQEAVRKRRAKEDAEEDKRLLNAMKFVRKQ
jgi:hypothetical protein